MPGFIDKNVLASAKLRSRTSDDEINRQVEAARSRGGDRFSRVFEEGGKIIGIERGSAGTPSDRRMNLGQIGGGRNSIRTNVVGGANEIRNAASGQLIQGRLNQQQTQSARSSMQAPLRQSFQNSQSRTNNLQQTRDLAKEKFDRETFSGSRRDAGGRNKSNIFVPQESTFQKRLAEMGVEKGQETDAQRKGFELEKSQRQGEFDLEQADIQEGMKEKNKLEGGIKKEDVITEKGGAGTEVDTGLPKGVPSTQEDANKMKMESAITTMQQKGTPKQAEFTSQIMSPTIDTTTRDGLAEQFALQETKLRTQEFNRLGKERRNAEELERIRRDQTDAQKVDIEIKRAEEEDRLTKAKTKRIEDAKEQLRADGRLTTDPATGNLDAEAIALLDKITSSAEKALTDSITALNKVSDANIRQVDMDLSDQLFNIQSTLFNEEDQILEDRQDREEAFNNAMLQSDINIRSAQGAADIRGQEQQLQLAQAAAVAGADADLVRQIADAPDAASALQMATPFLSAEDVAEFKSVGSPDKGLFAFNPATGEFTPSGFGGGSGDGSGSVGPLGAITPDDLSPLARAIYNGTASLKDLTPTIKAEIIPELDRVGWSSVIKNEDIQTVRTLQTNMAGVVNNWKKIPDKYKGITEGRFSIRGALGGVIDPALQVPEVAEFEASQRIVGMQLTRLFEKGRISDEDRKFYLSIMPNRKMGDVSVVQRSKDEIVRLLQTQLDNQLRRPDVSETEEQTPYSPAQQESINNTRAPINDAQRQPGEMTEADIDNLWDE